MKEVCRSLILLIKHTFLSLDSLQGIYIYIWSIYYLHYRVYQVGQLEFRLKY